MTDSEHVDRNGAGAPTLQAERMLFVQETRAANNLRDHLSLLFKHKGTILVSFLVLGILGCVAALVYDKMIYTPAYEAKSSILVKFGWENYYPDPSLGRREGPAVNQAEMLGAEMSILKSRDLKEKVIGALTPEKIFPELARQKSRGMSRADEALLLLDKSLKVEPAKKGDVIEVSFKGATPRSAAAVVNELVGDYIDKRGEIYKDPKSVLFLQNKVDYYKRRIAESLGDLKAFSERSKIIAFDKQRSMLLERRSALYVALNDTANKINEVQQTISELEKQLKEIPKSELTAAASDRAGGAQSRLLGLQLREQALAAKFRGNNPLIASVRAQIATVQNYIKKYSSENPDIAPADPIYQAIQRQVLENRAKLSALNVRYTGTQTQLGQVGKELQAFEANETQYRTLAAAVSSNRKIYGDYRRKLEEATVYNELGRDKMTSVSVIEPAGAPVSPVNPPKPLLLLFAVAIVFAMLGSLAIAYILELNKQVMSTATEAEKRLELPVLITLPIRE